MTSAAVAAPVEIHEHEDASGRPTTETRDGDPRTELDMLAERERVK